MEMLKLFAVALGIGLLPLQTNATAQAACAPRDQIVQELATKYGERQVVLGLAADGHVMELFAGATNEWTLVATRPDGLSCIVVVGTHLTFVPALPASKPADPA